MQSLILDQMRRNPNLIPDTLIARLRGKDVTKMPQTPVKLAEGEKLTADKMTLGQLVQDTKDRIKRTEGGYFTDELEPKLLKLFPNFRATKVSDLVEGTEPLTPTKQSMLKTPEGIAALGRHEPILHDVGKNLVKEVEAGDVNRLLTGPAPLGLSQNDINLGLTSIDPSALKNMGVSEFFSNVLKLKQGQQSFTGFGEEAKRLAKQGKPIPIEVAGVGTKEALPRDAQGFQWREITDPLATHVPAQVINNSIAGYARYGAYGPLRNGRKALDDGNIRLFTLYGPDNHLLTNVEFEVQGNKIRQMEGNGIQTGNVPPLNYLPQMAELIKHLKATVFPKSVEDGLIASGQYKQFPPGDMNRYRDMYLNVITPEGRKHGGLVERNTNDDRRYL
jgi:hypothetical protein